MPAFTDVSLLPSLLSTLDELGFTTPTEIQIGTLGTLLEGGDVVGVAETGSGKTLAYVLPMLHRLKTLELDGDPVDTHGRPRGLVLVPGRELGEQVARVFKTFGHGTRLRVRTVLGGTKQQLMRQGVAGKFDILVATPGRLTQLLDGRELRVDDLRMLVIDEADQMLDAGFRPVARRILADCPSAMQRALFSATMPQALDAVVADLFRNPPLRVRTQGSHHVVSTLKTDNRTVKDGKRFDVLQELLNRDHTTGTLLFANTRKQVDTIARFLDDGQFPHGTYMGEMDKQERRASLERFRSGAVSLLVATDLGGRGLDIERVDRVINVHLPQELDNYLHRVGRTARAGREGLVVNLVTERDHPLLAKLAKRQAKQR